MDAIVHIIEPTFESDAGHCGSFIASLCRARQGRVPELRVWAGRRLRLCGPATPGVAVRPHFHRLFRRVQEYFLLSKLLRQPGRILIPTAGRADLVLLDLAAREEIPAGKVFLYVHWVRPTPAKEERLRKIARRQPRVAVLAPTASVVEVFARCGFADARIAPYPITPAAAPEGAAGSGFHHVLCAGAARRDKGFSAVVDLVARLADEGRDVPVVVQASADHYDKRDPRTKGDLARLAAIRYPFLRVLRETLDAAAYADLFRGAICVQPYDRLDFADRISGVTLDAFSAGCPVVTTAGTWMARMADRFGAGVGVGDLSPPSLLAAIDAVRADYARFCGNALRAGRVLQEENSARHLLSIVSGA